MSVENVKKYLKDFGLDDRVQEFDVSSATVELAAEALGCRPEYIAKSLTFKVGERIILIVTAGNRKVDNQKYKSYFGTKAVMLSPDEVVEKIGHAIGGVCPFAIKPEVEVYLDESLKDYDYVYPACGSSNSAIKLSIEELEKTSKYMHWIDVCKVRDLV